MKSIITLHATPNAWLTNSVLAPHLDAFIAYLQRGRYAAETTGGYLNGIAHFAYWITQINLPLQVLDERTVEQFLSDHLPRCDCPRPVSRAYRDLHAAFERIDGFVRRRLRAMLRKQKHRPGQGRCPHDHKQWPNAFFADLGLFTMSKAHRSACQSRCGNN